MRRPRVAPLLVAALAAVAAANPAQARYTGNFNLFFGQKWLNQHEWAPVEEQPQAGFLLAFGEERAPVHFAIDAFVSREELDTPNPPVGTRTGGSSSEFAIGIRKVWGQNATHPHLGAGASIIQVEEEIAGSTGPVRNDDRAYGAWVDAGVTWRLAGHLNLGIEARYSYALATLGVGSAAREVAVGGAQLGLLIGYGW